MPALTACGSRGADVTTAAGAQASAAPTDDPVAAVRKVDSAALLPAGVRKSGTLRVGSAVGLLNELIEDGTYARIPKKWGTTASAIDASRINPPAHE
ncbi:hypothetical protein [Streptomyces sp.]|uniref:hypothetical protein n=1 Tax=Streptomyces sp. TaxID=1931 RepID=UPI0039C932BD